MFVLSKGCCCRDVCGEVVAREEAGQEEVMWAQHNLGEGLDTQCLGWDHWLREAGQDGGEPAQGWLQYHASTPGTGAFQADLLAGEGVTGGAVPDKEVSDPGSVPYVPLHGQAGIPAQVIAVDLQKK